jgi:lysyl-tRNA synthetase class 2
MDNSLEQIRQFRVEKLNKMRERGVDPYPGQTARTDTVGYFVDKFDKYLENQKSITLAGRLMARRTFGALTFGVIKDFSGEIQVLLKKDHIGDEAYADLELFDIGDIIQVAGKAMLTQKGEKTVMVDALTMLSKSLRPLPDKWHGITDQETRYRQRYLDLLMNPEVKQRFVIRHQLVQAIRNFLLSREFIEVDTPALQPMAGGALATPFKTHYEAMDADVYLRIAPELYLKRLIVGGFERVFEFARVFRNEGASTQHLQDFTMLEFYQAYADYLELMDMTEEMIVKVVTDVIGGTKFTFGEHTIDVAGPWPRKSFRDLILEHTQIDIDEHSTVDSLQAAIRSKGIRLTYAGTIGRGKLIDELYKETARPKLINPVFLIDHPLDLSPLAKKKTDSPEQVQRFQLVIAGMEVLNAFSELNDPIDQKERFDEQARLKGEGDADAHSADDDFVKALEYGMPPTAGWGMGIDRFVALLTNADTIREAVLFPFVKTKE